MASVTQQRPARRAPPPDGETVVEPYRLTPRLALRMAILSGVLLAVFAALFLRLWALQVHPGLEVRRPGAGELVPHSSRVQAPRGLILDRNVRSSRTRPRPRSSSGPRTCRRSTRALPRAEAARAGDAGSVVRDRARHQAAARRERPRHSADDPRVRERPDGRLPRRARVGVSGRHHRPVVPPPLPLPDSSQRRCSATSARSRGAARLAREGVRRRTTSSARRAWSRPSTATSAA